MTMVKFKNNIIKILLGLATLVGLVLSAFIIGTILSLIPEIILIWLVVLGLLSSVCYFIGDLIIHIKNANEKLKLARKEYNQYKS